MARRAGWSFCRSPAALRLRTLDLDAFTVCESGAARSGVARADLVDVHGDFAKFYGFGHDFVCLVRPDGHVGLILTPAQLAPLAEYLKLICDPSLVNRTFMAK
jgi:hypothetical protein